MRLNFCVLNALSVISRERDAAVTEQKAAAARLDAERSEFVTQLEHLKEQVQEKEQRMQEVEEQVYMNLNEMLRFSLFVLSGILAFRMTIKAIKTSLFFACLFKVETLNIGNLTVLSSIVNRAVPYSLYMIKSSVLCILLLVRKKCN